VDKRSRSANNNRRAIIRGAVRPSVNRPSPAGETVRGRSGDRFNSPLMRCQHLWQMACHSSHSSKSLLALVKGELRPGVSEHQPRQSRVVCLVVFL
jgi:hypothetical protein